MFAGLKWGDSSAFTRLDTIANTTAGTGTGTVCPGVNSVSHKQSAVTVCSGLLCGYGRRK
jgi:hypothetical protein